MLLAELPGCFARTLMVRAGSLRNACDGCTHFACGALGCDPNAAASADESPSRSRGATVTALEVELDPARCPLCGAANSCAIAARSEAPCWCLTVEVPQEAIAQLPEAVRDKACLCPGCWARLSET